MAKKLELSPDVSYMLGLHAYSVQGTGVGVASASDELIERFVRLALYALNIEASKIIIESGSAYFYNSKVRKLFDEALERRTKIFKYRNDYSSNYLAAIFDCIGGADRKGLYLRGLSQPDELIMENIGFHSRRQGSKCYVINYSEFLTFISPYSIGAKTIRQPGNERDRR